MLSPGRRVAGWSIWARWAAVFSTAEAVNASGEVVGDSYTTGGAEHAFSWTARGGMVDLGTLGDSGSTSNAVAVNASGEVVGWSYTTGGAERAFSWTARGGMVDLGTLGGSYSDAYADASGQVVGWSYLTGDVSEDAFSWRASAGWSIWARSAKAAMRHRRGRH